MNTEKQILREHLRKLYIDQCEDLVGRECDSKEYKSGVKNLEKLHKLLYPSLQFSLDTVLTCVTNILGIGLILNYEKLNAIGSKAVGFVMKTKH